MTDTHPQPIEADWTDLCPLDQVPDKGGKYVSVPKRPLAVFRCAEAGVRVLDDVCPHAGGSLAGGWTENGTVFCPWHAWPFSLKDGKCPDNPTIGVKTYETRVHEGTVQVKLPAADA